MEYVPILVVFFILVILLRIDFFFSVIYLLFAVVLLSRLWVRRIASCIDAGRRFSNHAFHGDQVTVELWVRNRGRLPAPWVAMHESLPVQLISPPAHSAAFSLGAREERRFHYTLDCNKRGYYPVGPLSFETGGLLGFVRPNHAVLEPDRIIVYPRVVPLQQLGLPTHSPLVALPARTPLFEDPACVTGVRDYQRGDSPRRIHWTATARAGRLLVKRYRPAIARETLICLSLGRDDYGDRQRYQATELAIVVAASIANHIVIREKLPVGLAATAHDPLLIGREHHFLPPRKERDHLMDLLELLARVQIAASGDFCRRLRRQGVNLSFGATIAVITGSENPDLFASLVYLRRTGFAVSLILVQPARPSAELQQRAELLDIPVRRIWEERDVEVLQ